MDFGGRYILGANRQRIWEALNDETVLAKVIPGCETITWRDETSLDLAVKVNLGVMAPVFTGELELSDVDPARTYTLSGRAHGKLLGKAHGAARVELADEGEDTMLTFAAEGGASGQLLSIGKPLIGQSVQKVIDGFFERFARSVGVELTILPPPVLDA